MFLFCHFWVLKLSGLPTTLLPWTWRILQRYQSVGSFLQRMIHYVSWFWFLALWTLLWYAPTQWYPSLIGVDWSIMLKLKTQDTFPEIIQRMKILRLFSPTEILFFIQDCKYPPMILKINVYYITIFHDILTRYKYFVN